MKQPLQKLSPYYTEISSAINKCRHSVQRAVNDAMVMLYWTIGKYLVRTVLENNKAEYGQKLLQAIERARENYNRQELE